MDEGRGSWMVTLMCLKQTVYKQREGWFALQNSTMFWVGSVVTSTSCIEYAWVWKYQVVFISSTLAIECFQFAIQKVKDQDI